MITTLQIYVTRELFKTFALTAIGLTLVFSLCGGVFNMIEAEVLTGVQMAKLLAFVLPVATTLTLPISALFACAIVYGRFASDNEFDACKGSGINIHRLLAPAMGLSVVTAAFTFSFANYVIPKYIEKLDAMVRKDIQKLVLNALNTRGYLRHGPYVLYAGHTDLFNDKQSGAKVINIRQAAFMMLENDSLASCGTADEVQVYFWPNPQAGAPIVEAVMHEVRGLDILRKEVIEERRRPFGTVDAAKVLSDTKLDPKWLTLSQLFYYRDHETELSSVEKQLYDLRMQVRDALFYRHVVEQLNGPDKMLRLEDENLSLEIRAKRVKPDRLDPNLEDYRPTLDLVTVLERSKDQKRNYQADRCSIRVYRGYGGKADVVRLILEKNVKFTDARDPTNEIQRRRIELDGVALPQEILAQEARISNEELIGKFLTVDNQVESLNLGLRIEDSRSSLRKDLIKLGLEVDGIIHSRLAFSAGTLVMLVLAAALGIIFRGGQLLTAFVISFVPGMLIVVMNIMGRQLAENTGTALVGLVIIWIGIVIIALADVVVVGRYLKR